MSNYENIKLIINGFSGQSKSVTIPTIYIELVGEYHASALLNQIVFWSDKSKRKDGLFYKSYDEWQEELHLSEYQLRRSVGVLKKLGLITTELKRANGSPTTHYRLEYEVLTDSILKKLKYPTLRNSSNQPKETKETLTVDNTVDNTIEHIHKKDEESPLFKKFYKAYPKKVNKGQAITTFNKLFKQSVIDNEVVELILKDLERRKRYKQWLKENGNYIPNPSTYLNALAWEDEYVVEAEEIEYVKTEKYVVPEFTKEEEDKLNNLDF